MNKLTVIVAAAALAMGLLVGRSFSPEPQTAAPAEAEPEILYWVAPMDPNYRRDEPGKSPMGMDLVPECPSAGSTAAEGTVVIDAATVQNIGVRTLEAEQRDLSRSIRAMGRVAYDERLVSHVHTKVQGWVEGLLVDYVGQRVEKGDPLLEIYSPELVATQEELLLAARYRDSTRTSPFEEVRGSGDSLFAATLRRLELWDVPERDVRRLLETGEVKRTLTLYAPVSGVVTRLGVRTGMEVKPNENLYTIADLSSVWVVANVYEYELPWIALGQEGVVELSYLPGRPLAGKVTYVSPFLDPKTRTAEVRLELPNPDGALRPEMFGHTLLSGTTRRGVVAIPEEAVVRSGRRSIVILTRGDGRFEPREVALGLESGDGWIEVREGIDVGDEVVVSSQFLIDSESKLREAIRKLRAEPEAAPPRAQMHEGHDGHEAHGGYQRPPDSSDPHAGHQRHADPSDPHAGHGE
ncbi:MAG: efflux RND transporter periplasmic adaptor subunit [Deltaproteobacteria bacterium]|jgi:multidrug efflux pump subunit AcrA (membrane-fusion protein)|nr:efflux RND transporter periplasmic adaptor subunit [Deltaproteobacteria bacterium]